MSGEFSWPVRVYVEDTDAGGIVFYANYLKFFERARTEWVRANGIALRGRLDEGIGFVVHSLDVRYHRPALLDDELAVTAELMDASRTAMSFRQQALRQDEVLVSANVKVACVELASGRPRRMPPEVADLAQRTLAVSHNRNE